jgi:hypothetical protein
MMNTPRLLNFSNVCQAGFLAAMPMIAFTWLGPGAWRVWGHGAVASERPDMNRLTAALIESTGDGVLEAWSDTNVDLTPAEQRALQIHQANETRLVDRQLAAQRTALLRSLKKRHLPPSQVRLALRLLESRQRIVLKALALHHEQELLEGSPFTFRFRLQS